MPSSSSREGEWYTVTRKGHPSWALRLDALSSRRWERVLHQDGAKHASAQSEQQCHPRNPKLLGSVGQESISRVLT